MRLHTLLAATAASAVTLGLVGGVGVSAHSVTAPPAADAGTLVTWGDADNPNAGEAIPIPADLTGPVRSVAASMVATGVVTRDGGVRVWGTATRSEVAFAPTDLTDAAAIALTLGEGAVLHDDGRITAWGDSVELSEVPDDLRAQAIALQGATGYAVRPDGTLAVWGATPAYSPPDMTGLVDVSASLTHLIARHADGTVTSWGAALPGLHDVPDFGGKKVVDVTNGPASNGVVFEDGTIDLWGPGAPAGEPTFDGATPAGTVVDLALGTGNAMAVTADGVVHHWGSNTNLAVPAELTGEPVSTVALGTAHAAALIAIPTVASTVQVSLAPAVGQYGATRKATATVTSDGETPTGSVTFTMGGTQATKPVVDGKATWTLPRNLAVGTRNITAAYSGDAATDPSTSTPAKLTVRKAASTVKASKPTLKGKTKKLVKKAAFKIKVRTATGVSAAGKAILTLKGKSHKKVAVRVNAKGKGSAVIKKLKRGKYTATWKYVGSKTVAGSTAKVKFRA